MEEVEEAEEEEAKEEAEEEEAEEEVEEEEAEDEEESTKVNILTGFRIVLLKYFVYS